MTKHERDKLLALAKSWDTRSDRTDEYTLGREDQRDQCAEDLRDLVNELCGDGGNE